MVKTIISLLVLLGAPAWANPIFFGHNQFASAASFSPTNISGVASLAWYEPHTSGLQTNSGVVTLKDLFTNGYDLTNATAAYCFPTRIAAGLNSRDIVRFDGVSNFLRSVSFTVSQPNEIVIVLNDKQALDSVSKYIQNSVTATKQLIRHSVNNFSFNAGSSVNGTTAITNKWIVLDALFNGASSVMYTNQVVAASGNAGANALGGITIAGADNLANTAFFQMDVAEIICYSASLGSAAWSTARSNLYCYLTNKYILAP